LGGGTASVIQYSDSVTPIFELTKDPVAALDAATGMTRRSSGFTATGNALQSAVAILQRGAGVKKVIILVTDGQ
jgi:uncharacterized protein with von Willebrand factor type A (vWA) domain